MREFTSRPKHSTYLCPFVEGTAGHWAWVSMVLNLSDQFRHKEAMAKKTHQIGPGDSRLSCRRRREAFEIAGAAALGPRSLRVSLL